MKIINTKYTLLLFSLAYFLLFSCSGTITFNGSRTLENTIYDKPVVANGSLQGNNVKFKALTVNGALKLKDSTVDGPLKVSGSADLEKMDLRNDAEIKGNLTLKDSKAKNISIQGEKATLMGDIYIDGELHFSGQKGSVTISPETTITKGIVNGELTDRGAQPKTGPIIKGQPQ